MRLRPRARSTYLISSAVLCRRRSRAIEALVMNDRRMKLPCVYIVGAGPGDPGLISVRGQRCLEAADVVVYDHQVHERLLRVARPDAEKIDVGAAAPRPLDQEAISLLLVEKAREGRTV